MIEAELTKNKKTIGQLKYDSVYLLKDARNIIQDRPNEIFVNDDNNRYEIVDIVDQRKYEQAVSECSRFLNFIKTVFRRNIAVLSEQEYDHVQAEYVNIISSSEISNGDDSIADVWNEHNSEQVPNTKHCKYQTFCLQMMILY